MRQKYLFRAFLRFILTVGSFAQQFPKVKLENGELKGSYLQSRDGKEYSAFLGVPYAKKPQRFKLAEPAEPWSGIREATVLGDICIQKSPYSPNHTIMGSEDCLFINIYSPKLDGNLPVMVFIHGGAFVSGSSNEYLGKYFMDESVVLATINYRLGAFGFLNTDDGAVEANLGLKDQLLALKFVQKNIKKFGGDPSKVTIFGESAGGALVHHHVLSPLSKGLFRKAIIQSGTALSWGFTKEPRLSAFKLGQLLGCFPEKSKETSGVLLECLKKETAENILKPNLDEWYLDYWMLFAPSVDKPGHSEQIFVVDTPMNILKTGRFNNVPIIFTACEDEGLLINSLAVLRNEKRLQEMNDDHLKIFPVTMNYKYKGYNQHEQNLMSNQIKKFYFGSNKIGQTTERNLTAMYSDSLFLHGLKTSAEFHSKHSKTFHGLFTIKGQWSITSLLGVREVLGVSHADDMQYLFNGLFPPFAPKSHEEEASKAFVKLWASFASTDDALKLDGLTWDPIDPTTLKKEGISYLSLDLPPKVLQNPFKERMHFWDNLMEGARPGNLPQ